MKDRCLNPSSQRYDRYGARGITVCQRWLDSFEAFLEDVGYRPSPSHSLERLDNNGNYEPVNVVWEMREHQDNNKSTNRVLEFNGKSQTVAQWSREIGIPVRTLGSRLETGWDAVSALTTPVEPRRWTRSAGNRLTPELRAAIVEARKAGKSCSQVALEFPVSATTAAKLYREHLRLQEVYDEIQERGAKDARRAS